MYSHKDAIRIIEGAFPALKNDLHGEIIDGLLHPQIGVFSRLAQAVIDRGEKEQWSLVTVTFMELWSKSDDAVKNALNVSFLEHLSFDGSKVSQHWAFDAMPLSMQRAWSEMNAYLQKIHGA
jgi:hypothetical protein